ncbi:MULTISPECIES: hypothetical protein [unclassified Novosphingobium]|uniref:hypothetical protein n=1 Tax=unclassified Novosphingobium TaxID=2644732 RepID=UPI00146B33E6|nr:MULTISPECIES: hypothetical protein [unclassified Novosphingobium]NMN07656.1 hypothetical protein [Novosphingobium sp. SG919]NMN89966.1 hypothetical protein [Novosphingobium sp. SG916]
MASIEHHMANPGISIEEHIGQRSADLAQSLEGRTAVYLDFRFWVLVREVRAGIRTAQNEREMAELLARLVSTARIFCPISDTTFSELMKIGDDARRHATAAVIDELSAGVALLPEPDRIADELERIIAHTFRPGVKVLPRVWTRLAYIMGHTYPSQTPFPPETERAIQKAFFDHLSEQPLESVVAHLGQPDFDIAARMSEMAERLNKSNRDHRSTMKSFQAVLAAEMEGTADLAQSMLSQVIAELGNFGADARASAEGRQMGIGLLRAVLLGEQRGRLPSLHVKACLHALFRWEYRDKEIVGNDLFDFGHTAAALGYCDAFLTEAGITRSVTHQRIKLDELYGCFVTNDVDAALSYLRSLS